MKSLKYFLYTLFASLMCACQGTGDPYFLEPETEEPPIIPTEGEVTLKADKTTLRADESEVVTFTVLYGQENISKSSNMELSVKVNGQEKRLGAGVNTYKTATAGTHIVTAHYSVDGKNLTSKNTVSLTATSVNEGYTLSLDKTTIEANGKDIATFTLTDSSGKNLVADANELGYIYFKNVETGENLPRRSTGFTMPQNGVYTFSASYQGKASSNTVTITVQNRAKYERYFQTVALMKCTGTWCGPCAVMANYLENVSEPWRSHMAIIAAHASASSYDPFAAYSNELGTTLLNMYGGSGYPFLIYDATKTQQGSSGGSSTIEEEICNFLTNHPATCGVAIRSTELEGSTLKIRAAMTSATGGEYDMGYILLADNQPYSGGTIESGIYNDIVFGHSSNIVSMNNATKFTATADQEVEKEWTVENFPSTFNTEDVRVVVFAISKTAERENIIDNLAICPLGGNTEYRLNE